MIVSFIVVRFGDGSAWRTTFDGDLERFDGNIRRVRLTGTNTEAGAVTRSGGTGADKTDCVAFCLKDGRYVRTVGSGADADAVDCVAFDLKGGRYARINRDGCALDWWASGKK